MKNKYELMIEMLNKRLIEVKDEKFDVEDKLNDLEFEESHLRDAINALSELN